MTHAQINSGQAAILARMSETRAELLAANHATTQVSKAPRRSLPTTTKQGPLCLQTPYAGLIAAALVAGTVLGPAYVVHVAVRRGLLPGLAGTTRTLLNR